MSRSSDEEIIKLAYSLSVGPYRYEEILEALHGRYIEHIEETGTEIDNSSVQSAFSSLEPHFMNAHSLMESQGRPSDTARYSHKMIDDDNSPAALIGTDGRIQYCNRPAETLLGIKPDERLDAELFDVGRFADLTQCLAEFDQYPMNEVAMVFSMHTLADDDQVRLALSKVADGNGRVVGHISTVHISWSPQVATRFAALFALTPVELQITQAVVTGISLAELARRRKRSVETVRHQAKALFAKLGLRSQTELACLYSGFSNFRTAPANRPPDDGDFKISGMLHHYGEGRTVEYDLAGNEGGIPVVWFPALLGGTTITAEMQSAI